MNTDFREDLEKKIANMVDKEVTRRTKEIVAEKNAQIEELTSRYNSAVKAKAGLTGHLNRVKRERDNALSICAEKEEVIKQQKEELEILSRENNAIREVVKDYYKLEAKNVYLQESLSLINLNEKVYDKYMAMFNRERSMKAQQTLAVGEIRQNVLKNHMKRDNGNNFDLGDIRAFIKSAQGKMNLFSEEQCKILLSC